MNRIVFYFLGFTIRFNFSFLASLLPICFIPPVMFIDYFPLSGCVTKLAEYGGQKAEQHYDEKGDNPTEKAKYQRYSKRYGYGEQPA